MARLSRLASLGRLTSSLAASAVKEQVRGALRISGHEERVSARVEQAREFADNLSKLKGVALKVGQQAAVFAAQLDLPEDVQQALRKVHSEAEPVPFEVISGIVTRELEDDLSALFATFEREPLGTASLAQAHAATLHDGTHVVVKVQHDGVRESVASDLLAVRALLYGGLAMGRQRQEIDGIYAELKARVEEELDYLNEAVNLQDFHQAFGDDPAFRTPRHHPALCTEQVLVMDRIHGAPVHVFAQEADPEVQRVAAVRLGDLFMRMAFRERLLHADPHPGNYLFGDDGSIGIIDFGCVKRFSPFWIGSYARLALAALDREPDTILQAARDLDVWTGNDPRAGEAIVHFCDVIMEPFRDGNIHEVGGPHDTMIERARPAGEEIWKYPEIRGPRDIIFLHRALGGMYALARPLRAAHPWGELMRPHFEYAVAVAEGRAP